MDLTYADYCHDPAGRGFRQRDLTPRQVYDGAYLDKYRAIPDRVRALSARRLAVLEAFARPGRVLDWGCGTGGFVAAAAGSGRWDAAGHDVAGGPLPAGRFVADWRGSGPWDVVTFFDSLEHAPEPDAVVRGLAPGAVMISVPECHFPGDPGWFMGWRHRRPGEHLWHWNRATLDRFFAALGYRPVAHSSFEDDVRTPYDPALPNILTAVYRRG